MWEKGNVYLLCCGTALMAENELAPPATTTQPDPYIGRLLAERYRILAVLGEGGMSRVYTGQHVVIERRVAVKILLPALAADQMFVRRFLDEGRAAGTIGHPNIAESLDMGYAPDGAPFLVFELLDGINLAHEIADRGGLSVGRTAYIGMQIAAALTAAHARDIIHRDLKPENIFLIREGARPDHVKVVDFGISKFTRRDHVDRHTQAGVILGTPDYMAPEQVTDVASVDARTDIYALGTILYTALTGRPPFDGHPFPHILHVIVAEEPPALGTLRPEVPAGLVAIIARAMAKDREHRYATMSDLADALEPFVVEPVAIRERAPSIQDFGRDLVKKSGVSIRPLPAAQSAAVPRSVGSASASRAITASPQLAASEERALRPSQPLAPGRAGRIAPWLFVALLFASGVGAGAWLLARQRATKPAAVPAAVVAVAAPAVQGGLPDRVVPPVAAVDVDFTCDAPRSRATLRGSSHDLPFRSSLRPGVDPEAIEVTAPGFQGRRFWVSLDRSRQLAVRLKRGSGVLDASSDETATALGVSQQVAAAAPGRQPLSDVRHPNSKALAAAAPGMGVLPESEPAPLPMAPVVTPKPAAPPSSPAVEAVPAPQPGPALDVPSIAPGTIDRKAVNAVIRAHTGEVQSCLVRARMDNPDAAGRIAVQAMIAPDGGVSGANIAASNSNSARLEQCVLGAFRSWAFPAPAGGVSGSLSYTFNLK